MYQLVLHDGPAELYAGIIHQASGEVAHLWSYENTGIAEELPKFQAKKFSKAIIFVNNSQYTLVPASFFDPSKLATYLQHISTEVTHKTFYQFIPAIDAYLVFCYPDERANILQEWTGVNQLNHHVAALIDSQAKHYVSPDKNSVFLDFNTHGFTQSIFKGKKLVHCNTFEFRGIDDIIYYTYYSMEQVQLLPNEVEFNLSGPLEMHTQLVNTLKKYSQRVFELSPRQLHAMGKNDARSLFKISLDIQCA